MFYSMLLMGPFQLEVQLSFEKDLMEEGTKYML